MQAFEAMYRWHNKYPLGTNPLARLNGAIVLKNIRRFAKDFGLYNNARFGTEIIGVSFREKGDR